MASLVSGNVATRYNEGSEVIVTGDVILAASSRLKGTINPSTTTTTTIAETTTTSSMDTSGDSSLDAANGTAAASVAASVAAIASVVGGTASLTVKAERPDHLAGTSTSPAVAGPIGTGSGLFAGIGNSNKTTRPDDWLATSSPESPQSSLQSQHVVYTASQQQLSEQPPVAHSSPHQQVSNNGYASPMSTGSYDPYSPNGKICEYSLF